jgi:glycosyltransferase involved in cell wall biosynthesis
MPAAPPRVHVLIPIFNDWSVVALLLPKLDAVLASHAIEADLLLVDDGSTVPPETLAIPPLAAVAHVGVLELRRNLGHQRAIAVGLTYAYEHLAPALVVVMDGDGEDDPADIPRLIEALHAEGDGKIVFAERRRRTERLLFRVFYKLYRWGHYLLTGYRVRVGNFSAIPAGALSRLVVISEMWNHYAAAVFNARIDYVSIPTSRGHRLGGASHMNFISLVVHGLSALSVYGHIIGVRLLVVTGTLIALDGMALLAILGARFVSASPLPQWMPYVAATLFLLLFQAVTAAVVFVFIMLSSRQGASVIPLRDCGYFVRRYTRAYAR